MQSADDYAACYEHLRLVYYNSGTGLWDAVALKALAVTTYAQATKEVTITATNTEAGGMAQGQMKFNRMILLQAIYALLRAECADSMPPEDPPNAIANFGNRAVQF